MVAESMLEAASSARMASSPPLTTVDPDGSDCGLQVREETTKIGAKMEAQDLENGTQKAAEDDADGERQQHLASDERTFVNSIIAFLGSGILGLPYAFRKTGILYGLITLTAVAIVSTYAMLLVVQCKYKLKERGITIVKYGDIGYQAMGRPGRLLVNVAIVISQAGFCAAYLIFIITNANQFLGIAKEVVVSVCVPPLIVFTLLKTMKELAYVALVADLMNFVGLAVVYTVDLSFMTANYDPVETVGVVSSIPFFFGVASYCFEGVGMVLPLENGMEKPAHFKSVLICTVVIITTLYATFGVCGYLAFGDATKDVVTLNMTDDSGALTLVKLCLCAGLFFAYPLMLFPVFELLQPLVVKPDGSGEQKLVLLKSCVVMLTAVLAVGIPNFGQFISFIGSTCCTLLAFVFPAGFHLLLFSLETSWPKAVLLSSLIVLGVIAAAAAVSDGARSLFG